MFKYLLVAGVAFASATFAFDDAACIVPVDKTGDAPTTTTHIPTPSGYRDVIYDDQSYYGNDPSNAYSIWGDEGWETADDFEVYNFWTLEMVRVWLWGESGVDIRVDIFGDSGDGPDDGDVLFSEIVNGSDITWDWEDNPMF